VRSARYHGLRDIRVETIPEPTILKGSDALHDQPRRRVFTHDLPLEDAPRGFEIMDARAEGSIKVALTP
jgi:hypothetical protein